MPVRLQEVLGGDAVVVRVELAHAEGSKVTRPRPGLDILFGAGHQMRDVGAVVLGHFETGTQPMNTFQVENPTKCPTPDSCLGEFTMGERFVFISGIIPELNGGYRFDCTVIATGIDPVKLVGHPLSAFSQLPDILDYPGEMRD